MKAKIVKESINEVASQKDIQRIRDLFAKSKGDDGKLLQLTRNMAKSIDDVEKAQSRADAAIQILGTMGGNEIADIFSDRVKELGGSVSQKYKLPASQLPNPKIALKGGYRGGRDNESPISGIGSVNLETGDSKYWNVYDTWENKGTVEVWEDHNGKYKLVFTSGDEPYEGIGKIQDFKDDQTWAHKGRWTMRDYTPLKDMRGLIPLYGRKMFGYVYK